MTISTLHTWHELVRTRNAKGLAALLADDVVFHSPVVYTPQVGKVVTQHYLSAAFRVFFDESFRYVRELTGPNDAVLEFQVDIDGIAVNGVDMCVFSSGPGCLNNKSPNLSGLWVDCQRCRVIHGGGRRLRRTGRRGG